MKSKKQIMFVSLASIIALTMFVSCGKDKSESSSSKSSDDMIRTYEVSLDSGNSTANEENSSQEPLDLSKSNIPDCEVNTKKDFNLTINGKILDISKGDKKTEQLLKDEGINDTEDVIFSWGLGYSGKYNFVGDKSAIYGDKELGYSSEEGNVTGFAFKNNIFPSENKNSKNSKIELAVNGIKVGMTEQEVIKVAGNDFEKTEDSSLGKTLITNNGKQILIIDFKKESEETFKVETVAVVNVTK